MKHLNFLLVSLLLVFCSLPMNAQKTTKETKNYTVHEVGKVSNADLLKSIVAPFKGKVILMDVWATWCGPCRMANKSIKPLKEELKDKDIVYVYLTGETSPLTTWKNMIPEIHGEHFRVSNAQWEYLSQSLNIRGIPTYMIFNKEGIMEFMHTGYPGNDVLKETLLKVLK